MHIKILGSGCKKCVALTRNVEAAAQSAGIEVEIEKVTDVIAIAAYGVMATPGLVINEKVASTGRLLTEDEVGQLLLDSSFVN